ncbi:uncharacterized protein LOC116264319 [Nymphaea colorata]|uniref:uncharacterized protein LOC116264319 n=1 Tax=Nymphaea colorata TaxID=210225 RepID=UPI00129DC2B3|nr:uncharacterized protein LOC116264319 [Nymphaea colorata]
MAHELWADLKERFTQSTAPKKYQIKSVISSLFQDTMSISAYYTKLKSLWDELSFYDVLPECSCEALKEMSNKQQEDQVIQFLMRLNDSFHVIRDQILLLDQLPAVQKVHSLLLQEERQREVRIQPATIEHVRLSTVSADLHYAKRKSIRKSPHLCSYCHTPGHKKERCYKLNGYPQNFKGGGKAKPERPTLVNVVEHENKSSNVVAFAAPPQASNKDFVSCLTMDEYTQLKQLLKDRTILVGDFEGMS